MKKFVKAIGIILLTILIIWLIPMIIAAIGGTLATATAAGAGIVLVAIVAIIGLALVGLILSPIIATGTIITNKHYKKKIKKLTK